MECQKYWVNDKAISPAYRRLERPLKRFNVGYRIIKPEIFKKSPDMFQADLLKLMVQRGET